jgi:hypothetical protein
VRTTMVALLLFCVAGATAAAGGAPAPGCTGGAPAPGYVREVTRALAAGQDVWGNALLAAPRGPTLAGVERYLKPLLFARGPGGTALTDSGVYYLPFALPSGPQGAGSVALHVADGSQVVSEQVGGSSLTVFVGAAARERYGSCLARLAPALLAGGYLPILETSYVDASGVLYRQESFAGRLRGSSTLVSFIRLTADARRASAGASIRFAPSKATYSVPRGKTSTVYAAWPERPLDAAAYDAARGAVVRYWRGRLSEGMTVSVPERRVEDALRALRVQDLVLTWRYSIGNPYEEFSFPEGVDVADVLAEQGFSAVARSILRTSLTRPPNPYPNWKRGERLLAFASYYRLTRDRATIAAATPVLAGFVTVLGRQIDDSAGGLLDRERFSSDIPDSVLGVHSQTMVWQGLRAMASVWAETGSAALAAQAGRLAARLGTALRRAVDSSEQRLPDGSLFVPAKLLDDERPYASLTEARSGSYWNLVVPYALASGFFTPGSTETAGILRYLNLHGSRLLGLVRAGAYALYGRSVVFPTSGTDEVYGINLARFVADNDQADQLVLSLYGELGAAMTPGTFVSGEGASVAPLHGESYRSMYLPPNGASNAAFLETLRLMLVHETIDRAGEPYGLQLAYATPRGWLRPGETIAVGAAPTSFGPVSFSIAAGNGVVRASVEVPHRAAPKALSLRLRLPDGYRIARVTLGGRPWQRFDAGSGTIDLTGRTGRLELRAEVTATR